MGPLPHAVLVVLPTASTDSYGNTTYTYDPEAESTISTMAWLQQDTAEETLSDGRDPLSRKWLMMAVLPGTNISGRERVVWADAPGIGLTFEVFGPGEPVFSLYGYHHHEIQLRRVDG